MLKSMHLCTSKIKKQNAVRAGSLFSRRITNPFLKEELSGTVFVICLEQSREGWALILAWSTTAGTAPL